MSSSNDRQKAISLATTTLSASVQAFGAREFQRAVLGWQRVGREPGIDATRVGCNRTACGQAERGQRALRRASQADRAQLHVAAQRSGAEQFGQGAVGDPPVLVHLEEAVARMHPALQEVQVRLIDGSDVGDAIGIGDQLRRRLQAGLCLHLDPAVGECSRGESDRDERIDTGCKVAMHDHTPSGRASLVGE